MDAYGQEQMCFNLFAALRLCYDELAIKDTLNELNKEIKGVSTELNKTIKDVLNELIKKASHFPDKRKKYCCQTITLC